MLKLPDKWLWDFWLAQDGPDHHLFFLQAPRSLPDPELRHTHVSIGHAVSHDLHTWQVLPDALRPGEAGAWDDYTTWTGSIIHHEGLWFMYYTGGRRAERGLVQRIGLATSADLVHWQKHDKNPRILADPEWYEQFDPDLWPDQAWRDPYLFCHPQSGEFQALITARVNYGPADGRGVIAHATSPDLLHWQVRPPLTEPGEFGHMEVPQWVPIGGRYYLLFCAQAAVQSARRRRPGVRAVTGTYYLVADAPLGPFRAVSDEPLTGDEHGSTYAGKLVQGAAGEWLYLTSRHYDAQGTFHGTLADPVPVEIDEAGHLHLGARGARRGSRR
ncbi:MAG: glycosyl hydrolase family 32 [Anaerolineae bacterium]